MARLEDLSMKYRFLKDRRSFAFRPQSDESDQGHRVVFTAAVVAATAAGLWAANVLASRH